MSKSPTFTAAAAGVGSKVSRDTRMVPLVCGMAKPWLSRLIHLILNVAAGLHELTEGERFAEQHAVSNHGRIVFL